MKFLKRILLTIILVSIVLSAVFTAGASDVTKTVFEHGRMFNNSGFTSPASVHEGATFSYMYGKDGIFKKLNRFQNDWQMWTLNGVSPAVGESAVAASKDNDGAIVFEINKECSVNIGSSMKIKVDDAQAANCDGVEFIVLQERDGKYAPLWPEKNNYKWCNPKIQGKYILKDVKTHLKENDKILFVVHSIGTDMGDTVAVDPTIKITDEKVASPDKFIKWESENKKVELFEGETFVSSGYINDGTENSKKTTAPFTYLYGKDGDYNSYFKFRDTSGECVWKLDEKTGAPWIGPWYFSASDLYDGVICFTAPQGGSYNVSNNQGNALKIDTASGNKGDGMAFAVIAQNGSGKYCPLYPQKNVWRYQTVNEGESIDFSPFKVYLNKGDKLYFIAHCKGSNVNDVLIFDPKIVYDTNNAEKITAYSEWEVNIDEGVAQSNTVRLSEYFNNKFSAKSPLSFLSGWNYEYKPLDTFRSDWGCWTVSGGGAAIGMKWLGAVDHEEAVLCYEAPSAGQVTLGSEIPLTLDFPEQSDGAQVMVYVHNYLGDHPLWPIDGEWKYQKITGTSQIELKDIKVNVKESDKIYILCRTMGEMSFDTVNIAPYFTIDSSLTGEIPSGVERIDPTDETYMSNLPDPKGLKLDKAQSDNIDSFLQKYLYLVIGLSVAVVIGIAVIILIIIKKRRGEGVER